MVVDRCKTGKGVWLSRFCLEGILCYNKSEMQFRMLLVILSGDSFQKWLCSRHEKTCFEIIQIESHNKRVSLTNVYSWTLLDCLTFKFDGEIS